MSERPDLESPTGREMLDEVLDLASGLGVVLLPLSILAVPGALLLLPLALPLIPLAMLAAPFLLFRAVRHRLRGSAG